MNLRNIQTRIAAGMAAVTGTIAKKGSAVTLDGDVGWRSLGGRTFGQYYSGSDVNWERQAGHLWENGTVGICLSFVMKKIIEPRAEIIEETDDGTEESSVIRDHPLLELLAKPNGEYSGKSLLQSIILSLLLYGEGFWVKARNLNGKGITRELWYIPHWEMEPVAPENGGPTEVYKRTCGAKTKFYSRDDVVHFKFGMDPRNPRRGWSVFRAMFAEVVSDREIAIYTATVLRNLGVMGYILMPDSKDVEFGDVDQVKSKLQSSITGDNRADISVSDIPVKIAKVGYSPQELAIGTMGERPEARVCAAFGLNPMAVNLPAGKDSQKFANLKEARAAAWEDCIIPALSLIAETINEELLPEFTTNESDLFQYSFDKVRDLKPDLNADHDRARKNLIAGGWKLSEFRAATGIKVKEGDIDGYLWELDIRKRSDGKGGGDTQNPDDTNDPNKEPAAE